MLSKYLKIWLLFLVSSMTSFGVSALEFGVSAELMYFNYEEFDTAGNSLDTEIGFLPGLTLSASKSYEVIHNELAFSVYDGQVDYDGQTQVGQPHQTNTDETIYRVLYKIGWSPENNQSILYAKAYWQQWDRKILPNNGVSGLFERYQWWSFEAGLQASIYKNNYSDFFLELGILKTTSGTIKVDLVNFGYGAPVLDLGDGFGFNGVLNYRISFRRNSDFQFSVRYTSWSFGRSNSEILSNGSNIITVEEPRSTTNQLTAIISYIHKF